MSNINQMLIRFSDEQNEVITKKYILHLINNKYVSRAQFIKNIILKGLEEE